jgi:N-methylhydantoinase A
VFALTADMRFVGQAFEVPVSFAETELEALDAVGVRQRFGEAHQRVYFFGGEASKPIEFVSFRLGVVAPLEALPLLAETKVVGAAARQIRIYDGRAWREAQLLPRGGLSREKPLTGPALIEDPTSTLYVPSGWTARLDPNDNTILEARG